jgi:hypothetical protein
MTIQTRPGSADAPLAPGLFMEYRVELREGGQLSEESFRLDVLDDLGEGAWRLELRIGDGDRYRCEYATKGGAGSFAPERFSRVSHRVDEFWEELDAGSLSLLADLDRMQSQLDRATATGDSLFSIDGVEWPARSYVLSDSSSSVQRSESVTLSRITQSRGRAWISAELPFGGWLRYDEEHRTRKISEFGGRRFEGEEAVSRELWTLVAIGAKK